MLSFLIVLPVWAVEGAAYTYKELASVSALLLTYRPPYLTPKYQVTVRLLKCFHALVLTPCCRSATLYTEQWQGRGRRCVLAEGVPIDSEGYGPFEVENGKRPHIPTALFFTVCSHIWYRLSNGRAPTLVLNSAHHTHPANGSKGRSERFLQTCLRQEFLYHASNAHGAPVDK